MKRSIVVALLTVASISRTAAAQLVTNGGFETGTLAGWSLAGSECATEVDTFETHAGQYGYLSGPIELPCTLSQSVATTAGAQYTFSFWLSNLSGITPNSFKAFWDGGEVLSLNNAPATPFTLQSFAVTATSASTTIAFETLHLPWFWAMDDVSVTPSTAPPTSTVPEPSTYAMMTAGLVGIVWAKRRRRA